MAKVSTFLYCLGTENQHNPKGPINAIGILPVLTPEFMPSAFSFAIVVGIVGLEKDRDHILNVCFKDNNNNPLIDSKDIRISVDTMHGVEKCNFAWRRNVLNRDSFGWEEFRGVWNLCQSKS